MTVETIRHQPDTGYARVRLFGSLGFIVVVQLLGFALAWRGADRATFWSRARTSHARSATRSWPAPSFSGGSASRPRLSETFGLLRNGKLLLVLFAAAIHFASTSPYYQLFGIFVRDRGLPPTVTSLGHRLWSFGRGRGALYFSAIEQRFALGTIMAIAFASASLQVVSSCRRVTSRLPMVLLRVSRHHVRLLLGSHGESTEQARAFAFARDWASAVWRHCIFARRRARVSACRIRVRPFRRRGAGLCVCFDHRASCRSALRSCCARSHFDTHPETGRLGRQEGLGLRDNRNKTLNWSLLTIVPCFWITLRRRAACFNRASIPLAPRLISQNIVRLFEHLDNQLEIVSKIGGSRIEHPVGSKPRRSSRYARCISYAVAVRGTPSSEK